MVINAGVALLVFLLAAAVEALAWWEKRKLRALLAPGSGATSPRIGRLLARPLAAALAVWLLCREIEERARSRDHTVPVESVSGSEAKDSR